MENSNSSFTLIQKNNDGKYDAYKNHQEALDYQGCEFSFNNIRYIQRTAKTTPKKIGQFVTLWKRDQRTGETTPFHHKDNVDYVVIICFKGKKCGRFLFSKDTLMEKGIITKNSIKNGKRGFRVYPNWDKPLSKQAIATQRWQSNYFSDHLTLK